MYEILYNKKFKSSYKKIFKSGKFKHGEYENILRFLSEGIPLPIKYHDHALKGNLSGQRECHITGDTLPTYEIDRENKKIFLGDIGNHAQVFE